MKILLIQETDWFVKGPLQQHHLMEKLSLKGHEIRVIDFEVVWNTNEKKELISDHQTFDNVFKVYDGAKITIIRPPIVKIPSLDYLSLLFTRRMEIKKQISEFKPDIIVGFQILTPYVGLKLAKKYNIPFIYYWTDVYHAQIPVTHYQPVGKLIEKRILKNSDATIVINDLLKDYVIEMGSDPDKTFVEKAGLDFKTFDHNISGEEIRKKFNINAEDVVILFVGWLYKFSGLVETALEIFKNRNNFKNIKLMIVGEGDAYDDLQKMINEYNMEEYVIMTGKQPYQSVPEFVAASNICILPSFNNDIMNDIVPIKMYEYMSMSKPVITTELPGVKREFGENNGVFYVKTPQEVFYKALELIESHDIEDLGKKSRNFVFKNDWNNVVNHFENISNKLIDDRKGIECHYPMRKKFIIGQKFLKKRAK